MATISTSRSRSVSTPSSCRTAASTTSPITPAIRTPASLTARGTIVLALRDIAAHEELTYDYSTYLNNPYESLRCRCGSARCRGVVGNFSSLPADLRRRYRALGVVGDFVEGPVVTTAVAD